MNERDIARFEANVDRSGGPDACHLFMLASDKGGYGRFSIGNRANGTHRTVKAHRVAFLLAHGRWPEPMGCHSCDVRYPPGDKSYRRCCNQAHIFEGTAAVNQAWKAATGRSANGERNGNAKLTEMQARALSGLRGTMLLREAAALFGVGTSMVSYIWRGERWAHL